MPRIKKEEVEKNIKETTTATRVTVAKASTKKADLDKKEIVKKVTAKKATVKPTKKVTSSKSVKNEPTKKSTSIKKSTSKKESTKKVTTTQNTTAKKASSKKPAKKRVATNSKKVMQKKAVTKFEVLEYYDLPYRYNQTIVKILYQTPTNLFIYWDISDADRNNFAKQFGENFFNDTVPVLTIHNETLHYSFEIEINDFANSWYLHVNDSNCKYSVELGRRPRNNNIEIPNNYVYVSYSNEIEAPNDHVLFNKDIDTVYFKDVKTNIITAKSITSISFLRNMGKIYNLFDLQTDFTNDSWLNINHWQLDLNNPSSGNPSSTFK